MKEMKRILSLFLCLVMLVGMLPDVAFVSRAAEENPEKPLDSLVVISDLHIGTKSGDESKKATLLKNVLTQIKKSVGTVSSVNSAGDMFSSNEGTVTSNTDALNGYIQEVFSGVPVNYTWTDHDRNASSISKESSLTVYDNYYIYNLSMGDLSSNDRYNTGFAYSKDDNAKRVESGFTATVPEAIENFQTAVANLDKSKPLFIVGHQPLFDNRNDNAWAEEWVTAINAVAAEMDVTYFFGHNHNYDMKYSSSDYYYKKGSEMPVPKESDWGFDYNVGSQNNKDLGSAKVPLNFTHVCAGYLDPATGADNAKTRKGTAVAVTIYDDHITYTAYDANGVYDSSNDNMDLNVEVTREFAGNSSEGGENSGNTGDNGGNNSPEVDNSQTPADGNTVYVLVTEPKAGEKYLITNVSLTNKDSLSNDWGADSDVAANKGIEEEGALLLQNGHNTAAYDFVTVNNGTNTATDGIFLNSGSVTVGDVTYADGYITLAAENAAAVWTAEAVNGGWKFANDGMYLNSSVMADQLGSTWTYDAAENLLSTTETVFRALNYLYFSYINTGVDKWTWRMATEADGNSTRDIYFYQEVVVDEPAKPEVTVTGLSVDGKTEYTVGDAFVEPTITATYSEGEPKVLTAEEYARTGEFDMNVAGTYTLTYTFGDKSAEYTFVVNAAQVEEPEDVPVPDANGTGIVISAPGLTGVSVTTDDENETIVNAVKDFFVENSPVKVFDITVEGFVNESGTKAVVTLPIPDGIINPAVYYVSDDGLTVTKMNLVKEGNTVSFETDHFSYYVISDDNRGADSQNVVTGGEGYTYVKVDNVPLEEGYYHLHNNNTNKYLTNTKPNNANRLNLVNDAGNHIWYIKPVSGGYTVQYGGPDGQYLNFAHKSASVTNTPQTFQFLHETEYWGIGRDEIYLAREGNGTSGTVHGYQSSSYKYPTDPGMNWNLYKRVANSVTYSVSASDVTYYLGDNASNQVQLTYELLIDGVAATNNLPDGGQWNFGEYKDTNDIISDISADGVITFNDKAGSCELKISYEWDGNVAYKYVKISTAVTTYSLVLEKTESTHVKNGNTLDLNAIAMKNDVAVEKAEISWSIPADQQNIATVDDKTGLVTANNSGIEGEVTVTATWIDPSGEAHNAQVNLKIVGAVYTLVLHHNENNQLGEEITSVIAKKGVKKGATYSVWAVVTKDGEDLGDLDDNMIEWTSSNEAIATIDHKTGVITFTGKEGTVDITATYQGGNKPSDTIKISASASNYHLPADGTDDFPEYPNEGAIRIDKTATAVGNFSETGITQIELSMTGVPYSTGKPMDVVIMLDRSSSMAKSDKNNHTQRIASTIDATKAFVTNIVKNEDGSFNGNRIMILDFLGGNIEGSGNSHQYQRNLYNEIEVFAYEATEGVYQNGKVTQEKKQLGYQIIDNQAELDALLSKIETFKGQEDLYGTEYAKGLEDCYNVLNAVSGDGNQQFCVFMSDGIPNYFRGESTHFTSTASIVKMFDTTNIDSANSTVTRGVDDRNDRNDYAYEYENYSSLMKNNGVTVFTVGLGLKATNSSWSGASAETCEKVANILLNDIAGPAYEASSDRDTGSATSKLNEYFFSVADDDAATNMKNVFTNIAQKILQAATDVTVEDEVTDEFTMIFDYPKLDENDKTISDVLPNQEFYIEFLKYTLDEDHERVQSSVATLTKLYLGKNTDGSYFAASNAEGTAYAAPVFTKNTIGDKGTLFYWTTDVSKGDAGVSYTSGGKTYYFVTKGLKAGENNYNMTAGAFATGKATNTNTSNNLVLATPYFVYNAATQKLHWTLDKLDSFEYVLRYFLYLNNSATHVGKEGEAKAQTYPTNKYAYITYTNYQGNECRQEFPVPSITWNGAQVSYVFYLVNAAGQPINKSGQVVDFANASFITIPYTKSVVWNKGTNGTIEGEQNLSITWLAEELLPSDYMLYDLEAGYDLQVYENSKGESIYNFFTIKGGEKASISSSLSNRLGQNINQNTVSTETTKVYNTKSGVKYSEYGTYASKASDGATVINNIDFANTTVAFAVVWQPSLAPDTIVVDYGLDVLINVLENDLMQYSKISGIGLDKSVYGNIVENSGVSTTSKLSKNPITATNGDKISVENDNQIRFKQGDMIFNEAVSFYYESEVNYYENSDKNTGYMYSKVTVIPATTIYYEDSFVTLKTFDKNKYVQVTGDFDAQTTYYTYSEENGYVQVKIDEFAKDTNYYTLVTLDDYTEISGWNTVGSTEYATQAQDRPGKNLIAGVIDANNLYGSDEAYDECSEYSLGSAAWVNVKSGKYATAEFTFYGTGFDIISLTSATTGIITINVYRDGETDPYVSESVDTYYGYKKVEENGKTVWKPTASDNSNALYQIPVMKIGDGDTTPELPYGKYRVVITATYIPFLDHNKVDSGYDFYLDAIRVYNPAGTGVNGNDTTIHDAYIADGEAYPEYTELRNLIIDAADFDSLNDVTDDEVNGIVFIDGMGNTSNIADYTNYGPNNEVYLASGQAVAGLLNAGNAKSVQLAIKTVGSEGNVEVYGVNENGEKTVAISQSIKSATDLYFDITNLNNQTLVIKNTGTSDNAIISITNIKCTYDSAPVYPTAFEQTEDGYSVTYSNGDTKKAENSAITETINADGSKTVTYTEKVHSKTYEFTVTITEEDEPAVASYATMSLGLDDEVEEESTAPYLLSISRTTASYALMSLNAEEEEPDVPETEPSEPETEPSEPETEDNESETKPTKPGKPDKDEKPGKPDKDEKPGKPDKDEKPGKPDKDEESEKPTQPSKPDKNEKPGKPGNNGNQNNHINQKVAEAVTVITNLINSIMNFLIR